MGTSQAMRRLVSTAYKIADKSVNVLIQGETGTGKEVLARFIHAASNRSDKSFIPVNCGALPENLLESELFGHEKGAFTGAGNIHRGIFEMADQGTLFLDEVGESSLGIQVKLLRVLETGEFFRVGGERPIKTNVRVIAASNVDLEQAMKQKTFREDLFYRLDVVRLEIPPLRERQEDIPLLAEYFLQKLNPDQRISIGVMRLFCSYSWPGNIRELSNTIKQVVALCDDTMIVPGHLPFKLQHLIDEPDACSPEQQWLRQINSCLETMAEQVDVTTGFELQDFMDELKKSISRNMRDLIGRALREAYGQYPRAAEWFRTTPRVLRYLHDEKRV